MLISYIVLAVGVVVAFCFCALFGRVAGFSVAALWGAATAYFVMAPVYSFRVSNSHDLTGLALFGVLGLVLARPSTPAKLPVPREIEDRDIEPEPKVLIDFKSVLADLMSSSELGEQLKKKQIEVDASGLPSLPCSREDAVQVLSDVLTDVLLDPPLCRISFHASRRPGVEVLFVDAHRVWPPAVNFPITIGKRDEDCSRADFPGWPSYFAATWFENRHCRIYQISFRALTGPSLPAIATYDPLAGATKSEQPGGRVR